MAEWLNRGYKNEQKIQVFVIYSIVAKCSLQSPVNSMRAKVTFYGRFSLSKTNVPQKLKCIIGINKNKEKSLSFFVCLVYLNCQWQKL